MLKYCIWAVVEVDDKGKVVYCPLVECMGCEECYKILEDHPEYFEGED